MMENNNHLQGEINGFWGDIKATEQILYCERENLANQLKNGLGNEIKRRLENPPKLSRFDIFKLKVKQWWNNRKGRK